MQNHILCNAICSVHVAYSSNLLVNTLIAAKRWFAFQRKRQSALRTRPTLLVRQVPQDKHLISHQLTMSFQGARVGEASSSDYRVAVFGAGGVGKSSIVQRFVKGTFSENYVPTIEDTYRQVSAVYSRVAPELKINLSLFFVFVFLTPPFETCSKRDAVVFLPCGSLSAQNYLTVNSYKISRIGLRSNLKVGWVKTFVWLTSSMIETLSRLQLIKTLVLHRHPVPGKLRLLSSTVLLWSPTVSPSV